MGKTLLIFKHEFIHMVRRTGYIILTFALPVLVLIGIALFHIISGTMKPHAEIVKIGYVDMAGGYDGYFDQGAMKMIRFDSTNAAIRALTDGTISEYFVIPPDFGSKGVIYRFTLEKQLAAPPDVAAAIKNFLSHNILAGKIPTSTILVLEAPLNLVSTRLTSTGEKSAEQGGLTNLVVPGIFGLLLALSLVVSSMYVLQGLVEEKENRIMEILVSSVSTRQLVIGKVSGIGAAGLTQVVVWAVSIPLLLPAVSSSIGGFFSSIRIPPGFLLIGVVYFILGYMLFAALAACVAAVSSTVQESGALASLFTLFAVAPFWFFSLLITFPNSPVWVVFSIFPFSAPVLVMLRLGIFVVPVWQLIASIAVLILSIAGSVLVAAKLLRTAMLMSGKKPALAEIARIMGER